MITISQVQKEISDIKHKIETEQMTKANERKLRKKIPFFNEVIHLLETQPNPSFLKQEIEKVETKIDRRMGLFILDDAIALPKTTVAKMRRRHEKEYGVPHLREQVKALKYILKK